MLTHAQGLMLKIMLKIQQDGPTDPKMGLCAALDKPLGFAYREVHQTLNELFKTWPQYSGNVTFPVPHPKLDPDMAYLCAKGSIWNKRTIYGRNRWSLLEHCIAQLRIQLSKP